MKLYGLKKCTTCQKAVAWLEDRRIAHSFSDVREIPLNEGQVAAWSKALGGGETLINRASLTWRALPASEKANLNESKAVALALRHPALIRRPLIEHTDGRVTVGFSKKVMAGLA